MNSTSKLLAVISLCVLGILVYSNTFHSPFQFDDEHRIIKNVSIRDLRDLETIWSYFPTRFVPYLSLAFNYHFNQLRVPGYHLVNLVIHLISGIAVWWFILLTFSTPAVKGREIARHANHIAFLGSLIFVAHPVQTEAVTYIYQRTASLAALFYLGSLSLYVKARLLQNERASSRIPGFYYGSSMLAALLGMFTKESVATLPIMILLYEFYFLGDTPPRLLSPRGGGLRRGVCRVKKKVEWKYIVPFLIIMLIIPVTMIVSKSANVGMIRTVAEGAGEISRGHYFLTQFRVMVTYLRLLFVPLNQNLDYDYSISETLWEMSTLACGCLLLLIIVSGVLLFPRYRLISFSIFWFFLTLSVESSVIPLKNVIFEHRLYLPVVGYSIFLPISIYHLCHKKLKSRVVTAIVLTIITFYSILAYTRNEVWKSEFALWDDTVNKSPGKARPYVNRSTAYAGLGLYEEAISDCNRALSIVPGHEVAYNNRGVAYEKMGEFDRAISDFSQALSLNPDYARAYSGRGLAYLGRGELDKAISDFDQALRINPKYDEAYNNRAIVYGRKGEDDKAISDFSQALSVNPNYAKAYHNRGLAYLRREEFHKAILDFNDALRINPDYAKAYYNRGVVYLRRGEYDKAISDFDRALRINPNYADAYNNRRAAYKQMGMK